MVELNVDRLLVCGDRNWTDWSFLFQTLDQLQPKLVIHGDCRGADREAGKWAVTRKVPVIAVPAYWRKYDKAAGPIRNQRMLDAYSPTAVVGFHDNYSKSTGTRDMLERAVKHGLHAYLYSTHGSVQMIPPPKGFFN